MDTYKRNTMDTYKRNTMDTINYTIKKHIATLRTSASGWTRELNIISWCDRPEKYDIRDWSPDHRDASRGLTLNDVEMKALVEAMNKLYKEADNEN